MDYFKYEGTEIVKGVWQDRILTVGHSYSYGDFVSFNNEVTDEIKKDLFIIPDHLSGSDYSGGSYTVANHKVFLKKFSEVEGVYDLHSGHGTYAIAIRLDVYESNEEIKEVIDALDDYPCIDDEARSEVKRGWQQEAMKDILRDIERDLDRSTNLDNYIPNLTDVLEKLTTDSDALETMAWEAINKHNLDWSYENNSAYLDYERVMPYVEDRLLIDHCPELPLLINREWYCPQTKEMYNAKFSE
jgi:hypothetical protein